VDTQGSTLQGISWSIILQGRGGSKNTNRCPMDLGKMKPSNSKYACHVILLIKKDGSRRFCGDYPLHNTQTRRNSFPMALVDDVINQLGKSSWFTTLDLHYGFWQIWMALKDMKKITLITKIGLYD
jgi:hypothetical protein